MVDQIVTYMGASFPFFSGAGAAESRASHAVSWRCCCCKKAKVLWETEA